MFILLGSLVNDKLNDKLEKVIGLVNYDKIIGNALR